MENSGFFKYTCIAFEDNNTEATTFCGLVYASSYSDAVYELEHYYDEIELLKIEGLEPSNVYEFNNE